jgi:Ni2+-binding GTPase involved in maturation of urease and hydrogenase
MSDGRMKIITVAGTPSSGKTSVIVHLARLLSKEGVRSAAAKFDALATKDDAHFREKAGIPSIQGLGDYVCPDHFYASNLEEVAEWGTRQGADILFVETAGLCLRCAPHVETIPAITVMDHLGGMDAPEKTGPLLYLADAVVVTKGDMVSQAEKEVFLHRIRRINPEAFLFQMNGLTGSGGIPLKRLVDRWRPVSSVSGLGLRYSMPASVCSYCTGERRIGVQFQSGNVKKIDCSGQKEGGC